MSKRERRESARAREKEIQKYRPSSVRKVEFCFLCVQKRNVVLFVCCPGRIVKDCPLCMGTHPCLCQKDNISILLDLVINSANEAAQILGRAAAKAIFHELHPHLRSAQHHERHTYIYMNVEKKSTTIPTCTVS